MPYVLSLVLLGLGLLLLLFLVIRMFAALRRFRAMQRRVVEDLDDRSGLLKARMAGVRVALAERRHGSV
ncbi:bacteriophage holin [Saccharopolyspora taberi]|uniref:Uncharacterized protein n=1 Tax=Saccharopolyspora taberi TaxID=60895 RepID=A0ABN3VI04_9PSEU